VLKKIQESVWKIFISLSLVLRWMLMWFKRFRYITIIIIIRYASLPSISIYLPWKNQIYAIVKFNAFNSNWWLNSTEYEDVCWWLLSLLHSKIILMVF
jgi:hypothetical protein